jgi:hypothetical protein
MAKSGLHMGAFHELEGRVEGKTGGTGERWWVWGNTAINLLESRFLGDKSPRTSELRWNDLSG